MGHDEANTLTFDSVNSNNLEKKQVDSIKEFMSFDSSKFDSLENFQFRYATEFVRKNKNLSSESKDSLGDQDLIEIPKDEHIRKCAIHLLKDDAENDIEFYKLCVNRLVGEKSFKKALALADAAIPHDNIEIVQDILRSLIETEANTHFPSYYIKRMYDQVQAAEYTIQYLNYLDVDTGIDLLNMCASQLRYYNGTHAESSSARDNTKKKVDALHGKICSLLKELEMYKQVLIVAPDEYEGWQKVAQLCRTAPKQVIRTLLGLKQHKLAGRVIDSTTTNDVGMKIDFETSYIFELLTVRNQESNKSQAFERLEALTAIEAAKVYKRVMAKLMIITQN